MAAKQTTGAERLDLDAIGADVGERFDAVRWKQFNSSDMAARNETRTEVLDIRKDLMKVAAADPTRAARIWDEHVPTFVPRPVEFPTQPAEPLVLNTIELGRRRRRTGAEPFLDESKPIRSNSEPDPVKPGRSPAADPKTAAPQARDQPAGEPSTDDNGAARAKMLLEGLNRQYLKADDKYHFRDRGGEVAFEAQDKKLLTQHETPTVVGSMIDLAEARGWSSIKLTGTKEFRREAWLQASLRDFEVTGYQPTKVDKARLEEVRSERTPQAPVNTISEQAPVTGREAGHEMRFEPVKNDGKPEPRIPLTTAQDQFLRAMEATMRHRGDAPDAIARARELGNERLTSERIHVGTLVEVGTAPYQDRRGEKPSHFVTLSDDQGKTTKVWGADLPRALAESEAEPGQKIAIAFRGRHPMAIDVDVKNRKGEVTGTEKQTVARNSWEVVQFDRLREDAKASVARAVDRQNHPAALKVFDPSVRPLAPAPAPIGQKSRTRADRGR